MRIFFKSRLFKEDMFLIFPKTVKRTFGQHSHCYITFYQGHSVLSINSFPSCISVVLTGKLIQVFLEFVFVFYYSMPLYRVTTPMAQCYLSFPLLGTLQKLKLGRYFQVATNSNLRSIGRELDIPYQLFWAYLCIHKSAEPQSQLEISFY